LDQHAHSRDKKAPTVIATMLYKIVSCMVRLRAGGYDESSRAGQRPSFAASDLSGYIVRMKIPFRLLIPILPTLGGCVYVDATAYRPPPIYITPSPTYVPPPPQSRDPNQPIQLQPRAGEP
jgi:hypothetical protein